MARHDRRCLSTINQLWSMDFMHAKLEDGRSIRSFNVIADFDREALGIEVDFLPPSARVIRTLKQILFWRGTPPVIRCGNGPENTGGIVLPPITVLFQMSQSQYRRQSEDAGQCERPMPTGFVSC